jgi:hypothetical protein
VKDLSDTSRGDMTITGAQRHFGKIGVLFGAGTLLCLTGLTPGKTTLIIVVPLAAIFSTIGFLTAWEWGRKMFLLALPFSFIAGLEAYHPTPRGYDGADFIVMFLGALTTSSLGVLLGLLLRSKKIKDADSAAVNTKKEP